MSKYEFLIFMLKKHDLVLSRSNELGSKGEEEEGEEEEEEIVSRGGGG